LRNDDIHISLENQTFSDFSFRKLRSTFSSAVERSDFCQLNADLQSPGRLEFQGHPDRIVCASKFLIKKSRTILFSQFDQEISRGIAFGNRLDSNISFSFDPEISDFLEFMMLNIGFYK
jgi:hypothetical protein